MNEVKVGKLSIIASYTCTFISKLLQRGKNMVGFCSTSARCFVLEVSTVSRFQNRICIANQEKQNKILYIANEEMAEAFFPGKFFFGQKGPKMAPKQRFWDFLKNFVISFSCK